MAMDSLHWFLVIQLAAAWFLFGNEYVYNRALRGFYRQAMDGWQQALQQLNEYAEQDDSESWRDD